ncbi:MoxR family ATPase [Leptolyngbya sp. FACHB-711]|uniref:AAA family ATPase n=1 Tax=unclassified Leptolyngbya TaxID=2650499 RepID=UPI00168659C3|nr:MoxR family ATPase [Leptolyngbya sp. FACHB-711]MBD2028222.1 AAA family ATPase [Leptolyngbya sp. FACHB-711]
MSNPPEDWKLFQGDNREPHDAVNRLPDAPPWRPFGKDPNPGVSRRKHRGETFQTQPEEVEMINAALYLRRPLLITGKPGTGKSSLAYAVAHELKLGEVLYWPITTRTTLKDGLYGYDAIGRLQEVKQSEAKGDYREDPQKIADYITLGPLGTALLESSKPRVLVIDEIDKSDIDLPNDLLTIFEEGRFEIPELARLEKESDNPDQQTEVLTVKVRTAYTDEAEMTYAERKVIIRGGRITCQEFPLVIMTSNGERDFPPAFLRRCLRLNMRDPDRKQMERIVKAHLKECDLTDKQVNDLITAFLKRRDQGREQLSTDQLLNTLFMIARQRSWVGDEKEILLEHLLAPLDRPLQTTPKNGLSEPEKK